MRTEDELVLRCACSSADHVVCFSFWPDDTDQEAYIDVRLDVEHSWWKRLVTAMRYLLFGRTCRYGSAAECILKQSDIPKLQAWVGRFADCSTHGKAHESRRTIDATAETSEGRKRVGPGEYEED